MVERYGGLLLVLAVVAALGWANSPWRGSYGAWWATALPLGLDLRAWLGDGLMTLFFLVAALELRAELAFGELRDPRRAAFPVAAAIGGMLAPALVYLAWNGTGPAVRGWGVPMPTDLAFALGAVVLLGNRVPRSLRVFLLSLAIVDDVLSLVVIAVVYSERVRWTPLGAAAVAAAGLVASARWVRRAEAPWRSGAATLAVAVTGSLLWFALHRSGVNPTLAGVAVALVVPVRSPKPSPKPSPGPASDASSDASSGSSVARLEWWLHPLTSLVVVPLFVLANAGVPLARHALGPALGSRVTLGVIAGKVIGKPVGITLACVAVRRSRLADLPPNVGLAELFGVAALAGVGFTVSLFFAALALPSVAPNYQAKVGILAGSILAAALGGSILVVASARRSRAGPATPP